MAIQNFFEILNCIHKHDLEGLNFFRKFNPQINLHPDKSLKNTGFKDSATANHTINLISKRSLKYQFLWRFKISKKF